MKTKAFIISIIIILVVIGAVYYYYKFVREAEGGIEIKMPELDVGIDVGSEVGKAVVNPLAEMPVVNPLEDVANPFRDSYQNPFAEE